MEFDMPQTVRCVRLFQNVPRDIFERESRRSWTEGFALQRWTGVEWKMEEQFWDPKAGDGRERITQKPRRSKERSKKGIATYLGAIGRYERGS